MTAEQAPAPDVTPAARPGLVAWYGRRRSGRVVILGWLLTRLVMLVLLVTVERFITGDVTYYWRSVSALHNVGLANTLNEYPTPVVWILWLPYGLTGGGKAGYLVAFMALMLALDAAFTYALWRCNGRRHGAEIDYWLLFVLLIGPLCYLRFDMLPAVLAGGALLAARRRPWVTGALVGLGAAVKLWPALLIPAFLAHKPDRKAAGWGFVGVGFSLAFVSLVAGGWSRLVSPLTWQSGRGLQVESVWATPLMLARAARPERWLVKLSRFHAHEIFGAGVNLWLAVSTVATVLGLTVIGALWVRGFRAPAPTVSAVGLSILATVAIMTITNKTLSPQYLLWMGGAMAALLHLQGQVGAGRPAPVRRLALQLLFLAVLTQLDYPLMYDGLVGLSSHRMLVIATLVTVTRNLALVLFTVEVCLLAWRHLAPASPRKARSAETLLRGPL